MVEQAEVSIPIVTAEDCLHYGCEASASVQLPLAAYTLVPIPAT